MRTTLSVDEDVLRAARQLAEATGQSVGRALSSLARRGLERPVGRSTRNGVTLLPVREGARGSKLEEINRLRDGFG